MKNLGIIVVTGGLGFIGKHFVRKCLNEDFFIINIDSMSYASDKFIRNEFLEYKNYREINLDVCSVDVLPECDVIVNFAAESHVDNSITNSRNFCVTNFLGVQNMLELARRKQPGERPLFVQISTDEVYGDISEGEHSEESILFPSNPYSASKAAADMLVKSWGRTYDLPWMILRPTNNYGLHQYPEKLIPKSAWRMMRGKKAIMHGDGSYVRCWLHAEDTCEAILTAIEKGRPGEIYNISGDDELRNIEILSMIADITGTPPGEAWVSIEDRSGQDVRYGLNDAKLRALGWAPRRHIRDELPVIVEMLDASRFL